MKLKKAKSIIVETEGCSICDDEVDFCFECDCDLDLDEFYCDGFGEHYCKKCKLKRGMK
jgi:hypothetical protein